MIWCIFAGSKAVDTMWEFFPLVYLAIAEFSRSGERGIQRQLLLHFSYAE